MTEPEVRTATTALRALPAQWVSPAFEATILARASLQAVHRKVGAQASAAVAAANAAVAALADDPSDATIATLVTTQAALTGLADAQAVLPLPSLDQGEAAHAVALASAALAQCALTAPTPSDYQDELAQWRNLQRSNSRVLRDAPVPTDADRAAATRREAADARVTEWQSGVAMLRGLDLNTNDVLNTLASAKGYADQAADITKAVEEANAATAQANAARREAGLNWSATAMAAS